MAKKFISLEEIKKLRDREVIGLKLKHDRLERDGVTVTAIQRFGEADTIILLWDSHKGKPGQLALQKGKPSQWYRS